MRKNKIKYPIWKQNALNVHALKLCWHVEVLNCCRYQAKYRCEVADGELAVLDTAPLSADFEKLYSKPDVVSFLDASSSMPGDSTELWIGLHSNQWELWTGETCACVETMTSPLATHRSDSDTTTRVHGDRIKSL